MPKILKIAVVSGLIAGLLVGGFHNLFTVPVMERAIMLEEERSAAESTGAAAPEEGGTPVSLGVQRIGMAAGTTIYGLILGLVFAGGYTLLRRIVPNWQPLALAAVVGALGFWALSMFPFIKFPLNPPGVGDPETLLSRQLFQTLFMVLSAVGMLALLWGFYRVNHMASGSFSNSQLRGLIVLGYGVFAAVLFFAIPGNPDPVPVPIDLLELFRTLTMVGQFLQWAFLAAGVTLILAWYERKARGAASGRPSPAGTGVGRR